jgi:hypothetical protein
MKYRVFVFNGKTGEKKIREVKGTPFTWRGVRLFTHKSVDEAGYAVSEASTGWRVSRGVGPSTALLNAVKGLRATPTHVVRRVVGDVLAHELGGAALN